ncbi:calcium:proton antiporter, partial [Rhizobium ruizarguesonis]
AEFMAAFMTEGLRDSGAPIAVTAVVVAAISAAPEILTALRAALRNRMQATVTITVCTGVIAMMKGWPV